MRQAHVAICIATYRRPEGLARLLASIDRLTFVPDQMPKVTLVIVSNDASDPGAVGGLPAHVRSRFSCSYHVEPAKGLAFVRNACLRLAPEDADYIVFVDDDEWVEPQWLRALLDMQAATSADVVQGPVVPSYPVEPPHWLVEGRYHEVGPFEDGQELGHGATGNVLISTAALGRTGATFSGAFNASGGEDVDFFASLLAQGCRIVAAADAVAHEEVPLDRMTLSWVLRRRFRTGHTLGLVSRRMGGTTKRLFKAAGRVCYGLGQAALGSLASTSTARHGLANVAWGIGTIAAFLGVKVDQYTRRS